MRSAAVAGGGGFAEAAPWWCCSYSDDYCPSCHHLWFRSLRAMRSIDDGGEKARHRKVCDVIRSRLAAQALTSYFGLRIGSEP